MTWLVTLRKWLPAITAIAIVLGFAVAAHQVIESWKSTAYASGYAKAQNEGALALEQLRGEHRQQELLRTQAEVADAKAAAKRLQEEQARNDQLAGQLAKLQREHRTITDRLSREIARVNDLYRRALDAEPEALPACVFTRGFVRVWDEATGAIASKVSETSGSVGAVAQVDQARAADQLDAGISRNDVLDNHVRNAEQCKNTAAQLDALIDVVLGEQ